MRQIWTDADFERMSWHDNHVHAIRCVEGENGEGELVLDIDHILEWLKGEEGGLRFRVQPATHVFYGVMFPRIAIDYAAATAAFGPFMIDGIERRIEKREHCEAQVWRLPISCPEVRLNSKRAGSRKPRKTCQWLRQVNSSRLRSDAMLRNKQGSRRG